MSKIIRTTKLIGKQNLEKAKARRERIGRVLRLESPALTELPHVAISGRLIAARGNGCRKSPSPSRQTPGIVFSNT
jgi:hypothetical protein